MNIGGPGGRPADFVSALAPNSSAVAHLPDFRTSPQKTSSGKAMPQTKRGIPDTPAEDQQTIPEVLATQKDPPAQYCLDNVMLFWKYVFWSLGVVSRKKEAAELRNQAAADRHDVLLVAAFQRHFKNRSQHQYQRPLPCTSTRRATATRS